MEEGAIRDVLGGLALPMPGRPGWVYVDVLALLDAAPRADLAAVAAWVESHDGKLVRGPRESLFVLPAAALDAS